MESKKKKKKKGGGEERVYEEELPDFISAMLVRWRLCQLIRATKALLWIVERKQRRQPCEYYDTLFTEYATPRIEGEPFSAYFRWCYDEAENALRDAPSHQWGEHRCRLRVCFLCLLAFDERVRRFVFARHDMHSARGLGTRWRLEDCRPGLLFASACRPLVTAFLNGRLDEHALHDACVACWEEEYLFRRRLHTVQRPSESNTIDVTT